MATSFNISNKRDSLLYCYYDKHPEATHVMSVLVYDMASYVSATHVIEEEVVEEPNSLALGAPAIFVKALHLKRTCCQCPAVAVHSCFSGTVN